MMKTRNRLINYYLIVFGIVSSINGYGQSDSVKTKVILFHSSITIESPDEKLKIKFGKHHIKLISKYESKRKAIAVLNNDQSSADSLLFFGVQYKVNFLINNRKLFVEFISHNHDLEMYSLVLKRSAYSAKQNTILIEFYENGKLRQEMRKPD